VKEIVDAGHTIGTHSYAHQLWQDISLPDFRTDLIKSIDILSTITGKPVIHHRAPGFSVNAKFVDYLSCLIEQGIQIDSSIFCTWKVNGGWKEIQKTKPFIIKTDSGSLVEFPIVPYRKFGCSLPFSGGGYFRLWPRFLLQYFSKSAHYVNWYFHPRDFDAQQPLLKDLKSYRKLMSYVGLSGSEKKFENLLSNYSFENYPNDLAKINRINLEELYLPSIVD
jgi:peptidoglycan-N-acetylglucosamine deacetylase